MRLASALSLAAGASCASGAGGWRKVPKSDAPHATITTHKCAGPCSVAELEAACAATPGCAAFNTDGDLKRCADCAMGSDCCVFPQGTPYPAADHMDLYIREGLPAPADWAARVASGDLLYAQPEPGLCFSPEVGNGFIASVVGFASLHVSGLFNGKCGTVHKARLPSPVAGITVAAANKDLTRAALDTRRGMYIRRYNLSGAEVEQRIYAHRTRRHIMVTEFELLSGGADVNLTLTTLYDPDCGKTVQNSTLPCTNPGGREVTRPDGSKYPYFGMNCTRNTDCGECHSDGACQCDVPKSCCRPVPQCHNEGSGCAGTLTRDVDWKDVSTSESLLVHTGETTEENDDKKKEVATIAMSPVPASLVLGSSVVRFVAAVTTSVGSAAGYDTVAAAVAEHRSATANASSLLDEHVSAWAALTSAHIRVEGAGSHAAAVQNHFWSSYYYLLSSVREDWSYGGMSPGGLSTQNYNGAVFFDMDWYMAPGLLLLQPSLAKSAAEYRLMSANASARIADGFGYAGLQYAWTAAAGGHPFGCCNFNKDGEGFENCIEQHITPDVTVFMQQVYRATGDKAWLGRVWSVVSGTADWIASRVEKAADGHHIRRVMPVDEWCDQLSGCAKPGVDDDPQMNAASVAALRFAVEAAAVLNHTAPALWADIADTLVIPFDAKNGVHAMPSGRGVPVVTGGRHTSCPEDVNYLSYPLGPSIGMTPEQTRRDMQYWAPGTRTCLENAGMTGPVHAIAWLKTVPPNVTGAHEAANRSLYAACYGPFNVRNEVDVHPGIIGGHFNNSHFLTGDGGYIQTLINGYSGLMLAHQNGMQLNQPVLPEQVRNVNVIGMRYLSWTVDYGYNATHMTWAADRPGLCLVSADNVTVRVGAGPVAVQLAGFKFSSAGSAALVGPCV